jgi:putative phosphoribosyl transferase
MHIFKNREAAGKLLAKRLVEFRGSQDTLVLGIPRGGVVVASEVAKSLSLPLSAVIVRKIGAPQQPELAVGAIDPEGEIFWEEEIINDLGIKSGELLDEADRQLKEIEKRTKFYFSKASIRPYKGKNIILIDDGIATGATVVCAINYLLKKGSKKVTLAVPVITKDVVDIIPSEVEEIIVLTMPKVLGSIGRFYENFEPVSDKEVVELLHE